MTENTEKKWGEGGWKFKKRSVYDKISIKVTHCSVGYSPRGQSTDHATDAVEVTAAKLKTHRHERSEVN